MTEEGSVNRPCWCGGKEAALLTEITMNQDRFPLVRCNKCGVYALYPAPDDQTLLKYYSSEYYGKSREKFAGPIARMVSHFQGGRARSVSRIVKPGGKILDVGCGNGGFLLQMKSRGYEVEGTEWTEQSAQRIPQKSKIPVHTGDLLDLDLPEKEYDAITAWHVFEHLRKPNETLEKIRLLLKPGGYFILSLPNHESWQAENFGRHWFHLDPPRHLHGFGPKSLKVLLRKHRFKTRRLSTWSLEQNPYGYIQSMLNAWGYPTNRAYDVLKRTSREKFSNQLLDLFLVGMLVLPAAVETGISSITGRGATMMLVTQLPGGRSDLNDT